MESRNTCRLKIEAKRFQPLLNIFLHIFHKAIGSRRWIASVGIWQRRLPGRDTTEMNASRNLSFHVLASRGWGDILSWSVGSLIDTPISNPILGDLQRPTLCRAVSIFCASVINISAIESRLG